MRDLNSAGGVALGATLGVTSRRYCQPEARGQVGQMRFSKGTHAKMIAIMITGMTMAMMLSDM
jgi:hypothetical protein